MRVSIKFPWNRTALIGQLARSCEKEGYFGRTALMKILYFLQEFGGVDLGYDFSLYNYGPFDSEVLSDLDTAKVFSAVKVSVRHSGGYQIEPGEELERAEGFAAAFLTENGTAIDKIVGDLRGKSAKELELLATIHFVWRDQSERPDDISVDKIIERVASLKPEFPEPRIQSAIKDLLDLGYIEH